MSIKIVADVGAPLAVVAVDQITKQYAPTYNEYASYGMAVAGYVMGALGYGGDFMKNLGIASLPWAVDKLATRIKGQTGGVTRSRLTMEKARNPGGGSVTRFPAPARENEFEGVRVD